MSPARARRLLSLWLPRFSAERLLRRDPDPTPFAVVAEIRGALVLVSPCVQAAAAGLAPGMGLRDARAILPGLRTALRRPDEEARARAGLLRWAGRWTPWAAPEDGAPPPPRGGRAPSPPSPEALGGAGLALDISGCAHLFGGEEEMGARMLAALADMGFSARAGIADSRGAAWALARHAAGGGGAEGAAPSGRSGDDVAADAPATRVRTPRRRAPGGARVATAAPASRAGTAAQGRDRDAARDDRPSHRAAPEAAGKAMGSTASPGAAPSRPRVLPPLSEGRSEGQSGGQSGGRAAPTHRRAPSTAPASGKTPHRARSEGQAGAGPERFVRAPADGQPAATGSPPRPEAPARPGAVSPMARDARSRVADGTSPGAAAPFPGAPAQGAEAAGEAAPGTGAAHAAAAAGRGAAEAAAPRAPTRRGTPQGRDQTEAVSPSQDEGRPGRSACDGASAPAAPGRASRWGGNGAGRAGVSAGRGGDAARQAARGRAARPPADPSPRPDPGPEAGPDAGPCPRPAAPPGAPGRPAPASALVIAAPRAPRAALAPLPVAALRIPEDTARSLARLGLTRIGDLSGMSRAALARRFGAELALRLDQATGAAPEPVSPVAHRPPLSARLTLPEPIGLAPDLEAAFARVTAALCDRLAAQGMGARSLRLSIRRADGGGQAEVLGLARPSRDPDLIGRLLPRALERLDPGHGVDAVRIEAARAEPLSHARHAGHAQAAAEAAARLRPGGGEGFAELLSRLGARIGLERLTRYHAADSHLPEKTAHEVQAAHAGAQTPGWRAGARPGGAAPGLSATARPLFLWRPEPLSPLAPGRPPARFRWRGALHALALAEGPERIAPEWWLDDPDWRTGPRDYWRAETAQGRRVWLFEAMGGDMAGGWFVHGPL